MKTEEAILMLERIMYDEDDHGINWATGAKEAFNMAISALEQPEIIRCEDCAHGVHSGRGDIYLCTVSPEEVREHKYDFYCGYAERRTD